MRIAFLLVTVSICGVAQSPTAKTSAAKTDKPWTPPKTPWGDPDLQGSWTSDDVLGVPMERPKEFGERRTLTEQELAEREKRNEASQKRVLNPANTSSPARAQAEALASGAAPVAPSPRGVDVAPAPGNWLEFARRASTQTSQVIEPPDGKDPGAYTRRAKAACGEERYPAQASGNLHRLEPLRSLHYARCDRIDYSCDLRQRAGHHAGAGVCRDSL